jgi:hypothetical protein
MIFSLLVIPAIMAEQAKPALTKPTDAHQARYWKLAARMRGASASAESAEKAALVAKEAAQKEAAAVSAEYQKLAEELKAAGCIVVETKDGIECQQPEKNKK